MNIVLQPSFEIGYFNRMINHPEISPYVRDDRFKGEIDCSSLSENSGNVFLRIIVDGRDAGFAIMLLKEGRTFEMHSGLLPEFRGPIAVAIGRQIVEWMAEFGAESLTTWAWESARHVRLVIRMVGFEEVSREDWPWTVNGLPARRVTYAINYVEPFKHLTPNLETFLQPCL